MALTTLGFGNSDTPGSLSIKRMVSDFRGHARHQSNGLSSFCFSVAVLEHDQLLVVSSSLRQRVRASLPCLRLRVFRSQHLRVRLAAPVAAYHHLRGAHSLSIFSVEVQC